MSLADPGQPKLFYVLEECQVDKDDLGNWESTLKKLGVEYAIVKRVPFAKTLEEAFPDGLPTQIQQKYFHFKDAETGKIFASEYIDRELGKLERFEYIPNYYCTIQFADLIKDHADILKADSCYNASNGMLDCTNYYPLIDESIPLLNRNNLIVPFRTLMDYWEGLFTYFNTSCIFIRPNSCYKPWVGGSFVLPGGREEFHKVIKTTDGKPIPNTQLCQVSVSKHIIAEYRFIIWDRKIITESQYRRDGALDKRIDYMEGAKKIAEQMCKNKWQPEIGYICDVAELENNEFAIVELNGFACSGLYAHDKTKIIQTLKDYYEKQ